jgi:hypothetical protein
MKLVFFKRPKPRQFDYKPLYYNKEKDEREQQKKKLGFTDSDDESEQLKARLRRKWRTEREAKSRRTSELRTVIYLTIAGLFVYLIFFTEFFNNIALVFSR